MNVRYQRFFLYLAISAVVCFVSASGAHAASSGQQSGQSGDAGTRHSWFGFDGTLLGGAVSGQWIVAEELAEKDIYSHFQIQKGQACTVYSPGGLAGEATVSFFRPNQERIDGSFLSSYEVQLENGRTLGFGSARLAVKCDWNPIPRQPVAMATNNAAYAKILQKYLAQNGLPNATPNIVQLFKVDLEGDGVDEIVICAQNIVAGNPGAFSWEPGKALVAGGIGIPSGSLKGNYSLLLLRKIVNGQVCEIPLGKFIALKNATPADTEQISPPLFKVYQFADLNGDGKMEILVGEDYYESISYSAYEIQGNKAVRVLTTGMGF